MRTIVLSDVIYQSSIYEPIGYVLKRRLEVLNYEHARILNVFETKVNGIPGGTDQGFIIVYEVEVEE